VNVRNDVRLVQKLLNEHDLSPLRPLDVDGVVGNHTLAAIRHFQEKKVGMRYPDERVDPGGNTIRHLRDAGGASAAATSTAGSSSRPASSNLSGATWWRANQARYPNSRRIEDLEGGFRTNVERFIAAMRKGGATVSVASTRRNATRAHLMHYSWKVAHGEIDPSNVPSVAGLSIQWDHGTSAASRKGAQEMVSLFNMAHVASLTSNHIAGKAIDMSVSWKGDLSIGVPGKLAPVVIRDGPRDGAGSRSLHDVGRTFGVLKLRSDPPHWSVNGR
jgi:hypothetical protein